ncbi:hypothetical protein LGT39_12580 [Demequina sp. TTPB684]|uniref:hypothetical protein n=1 Tax=Demequina sp. TMPB413 TaxID=2881056 RepID=UPI00200A19F5|nr:hypothetical protein [Demequina sp. TMPB413]MCB2413681.1 hypothetical protein [Demequina sp. TTPB684]UPU87743.1 hypothetical protein LGT36_010835 [Demequina sp. TMPB413]
MGLFGKRRREPTPAEIAAHKAEVRAHLARVDAARKAKQANTVVVEASDGHLASGAETLEPRKGLVDRTRVEVPSDAVVQRRATVPEYTEIVGVGHRGSALERSLTPNEQRAEESVVTVELRADPGNEKDPRAIAAFHRGEHIGFVAKGETKWFHPQLDDLAVGEVLTLEAVQVLRYGRRYVRVYAFADPLASKVGEPTVLLSIGNIRGQNVDQAAIAAWFEANAQEGARFTTTVAQLAAHPHSPDHVVIHLDGVAVAVAPQGRRHEMAAEVRAANEKGATLGAPVRVSHTDSGAWTVTIQKPAGV